MKSIIISPDKCIACGLCEILVPQVFTYSSEGLISFKDSKSVKQILPNSLSLIRQINKIIHQCPAHAIMLVEDC